MSPPEPLLEVRDVVKRFAGLTALNGVSFDVWRGDLLGLIGPNGAGKSVMVNAITGFYRPTAGNIRYRTHDITGIRPDQIVRKGIRRTFQHSTLFMDLPVRDNIAMGIAETAQVGVFEALFGPPSARRKEQRIREEIAHVAALFNLERYLDTTARSLPYGLQKVVGMAMALAGSPDLLLLDEPLTGLIHAEVDEVMACIRRVNAGGVSVLIIEHNVRAVMSHCNRVVVLSFGNKIAEGTPAEIRANEEVVASYLGKAS